MVRFTVNNNNKKKANIQYDNDPILVENIPILERGNIYQRSDNSLRSSPSPSPSPPQSGRPIGSLNSKWKRNSEITTQVWMQNKGIDAIVIQKYKDAKEYAVKVDLAKILKEAEGSYKINTGTIKRSIILKKVSKKQKELTSADY